MDIFKKIRDPRLALVAGPLILFAPVYLTGKALFWGTPSTQFVPWWNFAWNSILNGELPFWNPMLGMGAPLVANYQSALFYPPTWINFLTYLLGGIKLMSWGLAIVVCMHLVWAGLGTAKLLRELEANRLGQAVGGLAYSLSGYLVARAGFLSINAASAWIPWLLIYAFQLAEKKPQAFLKLSAVLSMLLLAGHAQTAFYGILLAGAWIVYWAIATGKNGERFRNLGQTILRFFGAGLWAVGISAIQLFPTGEYLLFSQRAVEYGYETAMTYSFWPWRFLTFLLPNLFGNPAAGDYWGYGNFWEDAVYIGLLPILLALGYLIKSLSRKYRNNNSPDRLGLPGLSTFLGVIIIVSLVFALGKNTPIFPYLYKNIPGANLFQAPTRHTIIAEMSLAILAGLGANELTKPTGKRLYFVRLAVAGCLSIMVASIAAGKLIVDLETTFFAAAAWAGFIGIISAILTLIRPEKGEAGKIEYWNWAVVGLITLDLISAGWGLNPGIESDFYSIDESSNFAGRVWMPAEIEYDLKFNEFLRFDTFTPDKEWEDMHSVLLPNLPMLQGIELVNNFDPLVPGTFQDWIDGINTDMPQPQFLQMMNISAVIDYDENDLTVIDQLDLPIAPVWLTGCEGVVAGERSTSGTVLASDANLLENILIVTDEEIECRPGASGKVEIVEERNGYIRLDADIEKPSWIFWSQTWYPGWKFKIDGKNFGETFRANYLFQAVPVSETSGMVEIMYRPDSIIWGGMITGISLLFVLGALMKNTMSGNKGLISES